MDKFRQLLELSSLDMIVAGYYHFTFLLTDDTAICTAVENNCSQATLQGDRDSLQVLERQWGMECSRLCTLPGPDSGTCILHDQLYS